jgi:hypothetical protein
MHQVYAWPQYAVCFFTHLSMPMFFKNLQSVIYTTVFHVINTGSRTITEAKQRRARSVFGWVTAVKKWFNLPTLTNKTHWMQRVWRPDLHMLQSRISYRQNVRYSLWLHMVQPLVKINEMKWNEKWNGIWSPVECGKQ